jgi:hypothetical protein
LQIIIKSNFEPAVGAAWCDDRFDLPIRRADQQHTALNRKLLSSCALTTAQARPWLQEPRARGATHLARTAPPR